MAERWYFLFLPSYWCPNNNTVDVEFDNTAVEDPSMFESEPKLKPGIRVRNLCKEFKKVCLF